MFSLLFLRFPLALSPLFCVANDMPLKFYLYIYIYMLCACGRVLFGIPLHLNKITTSTLDVDRYKEKKSCKEKKMEPKIVLVWGIFHPLI